MSSDPKKKQQLDALFSEEAVYKELKKIAAKQRKDFWASSLSATDLMGELYQKLERGKACPPEERAALKGYAAKAFRNILIDRARKTMDVQFVPLNEQDALATEVKVDIIDLHRCLEQLERISPHGERLAEIAQMILLAGMTTKEIALALDLSTATIDRDKKIALQSLRRCLTKPEEHP